MTVIAAGSDCINYTNAYMVNRVTACGCPCVNGIQTLETTRCAAHRMTVNRDYLTDSRVKTVTMRFRQSRVSCPLTPVADYTWSALTGVDGINVE